MDGFTFTTEMVKALAWPASAIILVFLLRKPIIDLVPLMKKLKYKELELEFSQELKSLRSEVTANSGTEDQVVSQPSNSKALDLLSFSARAAIMEAWIEVETAANEVASSFWGKSPNETMRNFSKLGEYLHQCKVIDDKQLIIFQRLRQLRNKVAHVQAIDLNEDDAKSFIVMAENLAKHIKGA